MPPRKTKITVAAQDLADEIDDSVYTKFKALETMLCDSAEKVAREQCEMLLAEISEEFKQMNLIGFLKDKNLNLFEKPNNKTNENQEDVNQEVESEGSTLITPMGQSINIPETIHPKFNKFLRLPHVSEEIAFSVNGSPMVLSKVKVEQE